MVQVKVNEGILEGEIVKNEYYGGTFYSFKGIPYAEPPIGDLRFKAPKPKKPWNGVREAKKFGPVSYQYDYLFKGPIKGSEDCLYLNIYSPEIKPEKLLPVMFYIHGGGFMMGSGNDDLYGPEFLIKNGVILVTINYRVEVLGFLCLHTEDIPGNAGMKDQVAAMRWVKSNISNFGGDPENITIFGESAGGCAVSYHLISPMTKGLFKRAIIQSGTANTWWGTAFEPKERAKALSRKLGNYSEDDNELTEFFKSQPAESFMGKPLQLPMTLTEIAKERLEIQLSVVSEEKFGYNERYFYGDVIDALRNGIHEGVEIMNGYTEDEGVAQLLNGPIEKTITLANDFNDYMIPKLLALNCGQKDQLEIGKRFKKFYYKGKRISKENLYPLASFFGFDMFLYGIIQWQNYSCKRSKGYLYKFSCKSERTFLGKKLGADIDVGKEVVHHADELPYIFPIQAFPQKIEKHSKAYKMIENVTTLWTNFAKYGNPTPDNSLGVTWLPYTSDEQAYLDIGEQLIPGTAPDHEEFEFWDSMFREFAPQFV